jgi:type I restriction-modification system DNA methylase subunit
MEKIEVYTEELTRELMEFKFGENFFGYVYPQGNIPNLAKLKKCLSNAGGKPKICDLSDYSKGGAGSAKPEFVITFNEDKSTVLVIECKKHTSKHSSASFNKPEEFAVDGALYYAKFIKNEYNVIAIGISGTDKEKALVDVFYWNKNQEEPLKQKKLTNIFLTPENYLKAVNGEKISKKYSLDEIRETAIDFHNKLREIKVTERQKPIFIAGILMALENDEFSKEYINYTSFKSVIKNLNSAIDEVLDGSDIKKEKITHIKSAFTQIGNNEKLKEIPLSDDNSIVWYIEQLDMKIKPMMNQADSSLDALGVFYHEFVKYSGGDGSGLGIVLTPQHLTEFMCELADIDYKSRVVDICCGSASFLVTAMNNMFKQTADKKALESIRKNQLYGIELDQDLYVLAIANMIIRKDGKSNIIHGDCFNQKTIEQLNISSNNKLNVGLLNPPYSQKDREELEFVEQLLNILSVNGKAIVVVPMSCAIGTKFKETRKRLFQKHTLKAVFSMADDIFYPTGTNVCVMVWEAHKKHDNKVKTYFGYYKNDGFVKRKKIGRVDTGGNWEEIKKQWIKLYKDSEVLYGLSAKQAVAYDDEWLAEAYMTTDYSVLDDKIFEKKISCHLGYLVTNGMTKLKENFKLKEKLITLETDDWEDFNLTDLFDFKRGTRLTKEDRIDGIIPLVTAGEGNAGVKEFISNDEQEIFSNCITIDMFCNSYIHINKFCCDDNIIALSPKEYMSRYSMIFISTVIELEKYRYQYGRQYRQKNLKEHIIRLPTKKGKPDFEYIENYVKSLPYSNLI